MDPLSGSVSYFLLLQVFPPQLDLHGSMKMRQQLKYESDGHQKEKQWVQSGRAAVSYAWRRWWRDDLVLNPRQIGRIDSLNKKILMTGTFWGGIKDGNFFRVSCDADKNHDIKAVYTFQNRVSASDPASARWDTSHVCPISKRTLFGDEDKSRKSVKGSNFLFPAIKRVFRHYGCQSPKTLSVFLHNKTYETNGKRVGVSVKLTVWPHIHLSLVGICGTGGHH